MVGPAKLEMAPEESMFNSRWDELLDASPVSSGESSGQMYWPSMKYTAPGFCEGITSDDGTRQRRAVDPEKDGLAGGYGK